MVFPQLHFRSISLPSRLHPTNATKFESDLQKLKSWQGSCLSGTSPKMSETIRSGLLGVADFHRSVEELTLVMFKAKLDQSAIFQHCRDERSMECSIELLDSCNAVKEVVQAMKENVRSLQSALRRKGLDSSIQDDIASYFVFRRRINRCIIKTLKTLTKLETKNGSNVVKNGYESFVSGSMEVTGITLAILKCILMFFSWPKAQQQGWNLVSRLMVSRSSVSSRDSSNIIGEMGSVDFSLDALQRRSRDDSTRVDIDNLQLLESLKTLDSFIEGFELGLERLFRQLLRNRVSFLNSLTDNLC